MSQSTTKSTAQKPEATPKFCVPLTQSYRLVADESGTIRNLVLQRKVTVDPTKAPGFAKRSHVDPTLSTEPYDSWRDDGYYPVNSAGLTTAIECAVIRTVCADGAESLAEMLAKIKAEIDRIGIAVDNAFRPAQETDNSEEGAE
jgi:hypothetical protein